MPNLNEYYQYYYNTELTIQYHNNYNHYIENAAQDFDPGNTQSNVRCSISASALKDVVTFEDTNMNG